MEIIPAIDLIGGRCVRLLQGDYGEKKEYSIDPLEMAKKFEKDGASVIHIIDLEGAKEGMMKNREIILRIAQEVNIPVQTGGGIRTYEDAKFLLENGIERVILSTAALKDPRLLSRLLREFSPERIIVSVDAKDGMVAVHGWEEVSNIPVADFADELRKYGIRTIIFTDIHRDGTLQGPNFESISNIQKSGLQVIAAGGVSSEKDIEALRTMNLFGVVIGKAMYEGKIDLRSCVERGVKTPSNSPLSGGGHESSSPLIGGIEGGSFAKRLIACMDVNGGRVVKGTNYQDLQDAGDPVELGKLYSEAGADELVFLDITATEEKRKTLVELVGRISQNINIPFTVGGGMRNIEDIRSALTHGADKVAIESAAVTNPDLIREAAEIFGSQCIIISISPRKNGKKWEIFIKGGKKNTGIDAIEFAKKMEELGAGELLVNSLDRDGTKNGYDLELLRAITDTVSIPVIASSGAGTKEHFLEAFTEAHADAALAAGIFHSGELHISELKEYLRVHHISLRT